MHNEGRIASRLWHESYNMYKSCFLRYIGIVFRPDATALLLDSTSSPNIDGHLSYSL